MINTYQPALLT